MGLGCVTGVLSSLRSNFMKFQWVFSGFQKPFRGLGGSCIRYMGSEVIIAGFWKNFMNFRRISSGFKWRFGDFDGS